MKLKLKKPHKKKEEIKNKKNMMLDQLGVIKNKSTILKEDRLEMKKWKLSLTALPCYNLT